VAVSAQGSLTRTGDALAKSRITRKVGSQRQQIHKEAYEILGLRVIAACHIRSKDDIRLVGVVDNEALERRQHRHENRSSFSLAEPPDAIGECVWQQGLMHCSP